LAKQQIRVLQHVIWWDIVGQAWKQMPLTQHLDKKMDYWVGGFWLQKFVLVATLELQLMSKLQTYYQRYGTYTLMHSVGPLPVLSRSYRANGTKLGGKKIPQAAITTMLEILFLDHYSMTLATQTFGRLCNHLLHQQPQYHWFCLPTLWMAVLQSYILTYPTQKIS